MRSVTVLLVVLAILSAGCGGSDSQTAEIGWESHRVDDGGFLIEVPSSWRTLDKIDQRSLEKLVADNPEFAGIERAATAGIFKFIALDPDASSGFASNVNVVVHDLGRMIGLV